MPNRPRKPTAAKLRSWRVSILRERLRYLGTVDARDEKTAAAAAVAEFNLSDEQRRRLVVQERN
jgi:restriction endonuclease Mrr